MKLDIETLHLPDERYSEKPTEDFSTVRDNCFCVADGITRDPIGYPDFTDYTIKELLKYYPRPSPAAKAADTVCRTFVQAVTNSGPKNAMVKANHAVAKINTGLKVDYLENDFAGCVAAGGKIEDDRLEWSSITDCQIAVSNKNGVKKFLSPDGMKMWDRYQQAHNLGDWNKPQYRKLVRSQYRNNPAEPHAYGALTGEPAAEHYIMDGVVKLEPGDLVACFTDGFTWHFELPEFYKLIHNLEEFKQWDHKLIKQDEKYAHERIMVLIKVQ